MHDPEVLVQGESDNTARYKKQWQWDWEMGHVIMERGLGGGPESGDTVRLKLSSLALSPAGYGPWAGR